MKNIGIFIKYHESIFTNGCIQQGYFLLKSLRKISNCNFITTDKNFNTLTFIDEQVKLIDNSCLLENYDIIIFSSGIISNLSYLSYCKLAGIKLINLMVGNYYILNQEEIVFKKHNVIKNMHNDFIDEIWMMPMYSHNKDYIEFMCNKKVKIVPYVWDPSLIENYICGKNITPFYLPKKTNKINILIMEPNMSIHKTCLVPLLIANKFFLKYPQRLNKVFLLCKPNNNYKDTLFFLDIIKFNKIQDYNRLISIDFFSKLNSLKDSFVIVSSNIRNNLNFLHLEAFYFDIPIIHNCKPFSENGLYYSDNDQESNYNKAVEYLYNISNCNYNLNCKHIIKKYNPKEKTNIENYKKEIKSLNFVPSIIENLKSIFKNNYINKIKEKNVLVIFEGKDIDYDILNKNIENLIKYKLENFKIIIYSFNIITIENPNIDIEVRKIPEKYRKNRLIYVMFKINEKNVIIIDSNKLINFDISILFNNYSLVYIELRKGIDLKDNIYDKNLWTIKNIFAKFSCTESIKLFSNEFIYYKNNNYIKSIAEFLTKNNIENSWTILNAILLMYCKKNINLAGNPYYIFNNNIFSGYSFVNNNVPIIVSYKSKFFREIKLIKSYSNLKMINKTSVYYDINIKENKIYTYEI